MRIIHLVDHFQPFLGYQETYLPLEQTRTGETVLVATSNRYTREVRKLTNSKTLPTGPMIEREIHVHRLPVYLETPTQASYVWMKGLEGVISSFRPEIVHCHGVLSISSFQIASLKSKYGFKLLLDNHNSFLNIYKQSSKRPTIILKQIFHKGLAAIVGRRVLAAADAIVAIGEPERDFLYWLFRRRCPDVPIIRLGADHEQFIYKPDSCREIRDSVGWAHPNLIVLGHAGALRPGKELEQMLRAGQRLGALKERLRLLLVGSITDEYKASLYRLSDRLGYKKDQLHFTGHIPVEKLPDYLSAMDIAVWPGDISITIIEAMSVSLPVITTRTEYTETIVETYGAGILTQRGDMNDLANALRTLVSSPEMRKSMSEKARFAVETDLNWKSISKSFLELYHKLIIS
jgi:glycosyltransferase involved in cell wall biosynthesis